MAVLKGSTSANFSAVARDSKDNANKASKIMYFTAHKRSCTAQGSSYCFILSFLAASLINSCNAPKGHNQPQNTPRPHNKTLRATKHHITKITGSIRKVSHLKPSIRECTKVNTFTTDICPRAYQPINTTVNVR